MGSLPLDVRLREDGPAPAPAQERCREAASLSCGARAINSLSFQLKPAGTACRDSSNSCDLPEFCTGASPQCPANVYLHDGHPCQGVDGYCYNGICQTHEQQCVTLWGPGTWPPPVGAEPWGLGSSLGSRKRRSRRAVCKASLPSAGAIGSLEGLGPCQALGVQKGALPRARPTGRGVNTCCAPCGAMGRTSRDPCPQMA